MTPLAQRIFDRCHPEPNSGCWIFVGWDSGNGYGKVSVDGKACMAHRTMYEELIGTIPEGLILDHKCRVRPCCNPQHLEPVTVAENTRRGEAVLFERKEMTRGTS